MDGMNWARGNEFDLQAQQKDEERKAFRTAMLATAALVVLSLAFVLGLSAMGVPMAAEEFSSPPVETVG